MRGLRGVIIGCMTIAIIGTAGRDKSKPMTAQLWDAMCDDARARVPQGATLVSGGAAWADHLAVRLFLDGHAGGLILHLPSTFAHCRAFAGGRGSAGSAANYYHGLFKVATGVDGIPEICDAVWRGAQYTTQAPDIGMGAFMIRNMEVAKMADTLIAYTWGERAAPADGGTAHTWRICKGSKTHVALATLLSNK